MFRPSFVVVLVALAACSQKPAAKTDPTPVVSASAPLVVAPPGATPCGTAGPACFRFDAAEAAFMWILAKDPLVLAVGEAHAQKGTEAIASSTKRFTETFLPLLAPKASDIVVELWAPDPKCKKEVAVVATAQRPIIEAQAETNQNEYVTLGTKAKAAGMTPWLLKPTCDDFAMLADAGPDDSVGEMLGLVKSLTEQRLVQLMNHNRAIQGTPGDASRGSAEGGTRDAGTKAVVAYGGALHNDLNPPPETRDYSFGPDLDRITGGRYVELDLIVPEFIKKSPTWEKLPWFAAFEADRAAGKDQDKATLYVLADRSFTLIFPRRQNRIELAATCPSKGRCPQANRP